MPITLMPLPFDKTALAPAISAETLEFHHGKHHKAYVDKTNELTAGTDLEGSSLEEIIAAAAAKDEKLFNQSAQVWNHGFYWKSLSPDQTEASAKLKSAIDASFGSHDDMIAKLVEAGVGHFASGWAWIVAKGDTLSIVTTHDAGLPDDSDGIPLVVLDVWEHAYYIDRRNDRKAYLTAAAKLLDWDFASANFTSGERWTYPA
ncbi:MAG: superoxide dismutase [Novosphingobium sp.]